LTNCIDRARLRSITTQRTPVVRDEKSIILEL
jgi:hypothetical protein